MTMYINKFICKIQYLYNNLFTPICYLEGGQMCNTNFLLFCLLVSVFCSWTFLSYASELDHCFSLGEPSSVWNLSWHICDDVQPTLAILAVAILAGLDQDRLSWIAVIRFIIKFVLNRTRPSWRFVESSPVWDFLNEIRLHLCIHSSKWNWNDFISNAMESLSTKGSSLRLSSITIK